MSNKQTTTKGFNRAAMLADPHAELARIREEGDLLWSSSQRVWLALSMAVVSEALRDKRLAVLDSRTNFQRAATLSKRPLANLVSVSEWVPFMLEGDEHKVLRALYARILSQLKGPYLEAYAQTSRDLLNAMIAKGEADFAADYADLIHVYALARVAGFDPQVTEQLAAEMHSDGLTELLPRLAELIAVDARIKRMYALIDQALQATEGSAFLELLRTELARAGVDDSPRGQVPIMFALLLLGRDTFSSTLSFGLRYLMEKSGGALVAKGWGDPRSLTDEFLRLPTAVQFIFREATEDIRLAGQPIAKGEVIALFLNGANRDTAAFACPHAMDASQKGHVAFGAARHLCSGMPLSKEAMSLSLEHLNAIERIEPLPGARDSSKTPLLRKVERFPIRIQGDAIR